MSKRVEYEVALVDGNVERLKERLQRYADQGFRVAATAHNVVIMERKVRSHEKEEGEDAEE